MTKGLLHVRYEFEIRYLLYAPYEWPIPQWNATAETGSESKGPSVAAVGQLSTVCHDTKSLRRFHFPWYSSSFCFVRLFAAHWIAQLKEAAHFTLLNFMNASPSCLSHYLSLWPSPVAKAGRWVYSDELFYIPCQLVSALGCWRLSFAFVCLITVMENTRKFEPEKVVFNHLDWLPAARTIAQ